MMQIYRSNAYTEEEQKMLFELIISLNKGGALDSYMKENFYESGRNVVLAAEEEFDNYRRLIKNGEL